VSEEREMALGLVVTQWVADRVAPGIAAIRENGKKHLVPGESIAAVSPIDGAVLGSITRTKPKPVAKVTDMAALMAHVQDTNPEELRDIDYISGSDEEVLAALKDSHPHLVKQRVEVSEQHLSFVLKKAAGSKDYRPPGVEVSTPTGTVNIYPADDADEAIQAVIRARVVDLDGSVNPALPGGSE
jgi:hypothetical protein